MKILIKFQIVAISPNYHFLHDLHKNIVNSSWQMNVIVFLPTPSPPPTPPISVFHVRIIFMGSVSRMGSFPQCQERAFRKSLQYMLLFPRRLCVIPSSPAPEGWGRKDREQRRCSQGAKLHDFAQS